MADAGEADHFIGNESKGASGTLDQNDLQTLMIFKMNDLNGHDLLQIFVLEIGQFILEIPFSMIVDQANDPHHDVIARLACMEDESITNERSEALRAISKTTIIGHAIEAIGDILRNRNAEANERRRVFSHMNRVTNLHFRNTLEKCCQGKGERSVLGGVAERFSGCLKD